MQKVTLILNAIERGDAEAAEKLLPVVYEELRQMAAAKMAQEKPGNTLQATALVHEAYLRLAGSEGQGWKSRTYFFGAAAEAMRRILVESARRKKRLKRGGDRQRMEILDGELAMDEPAEDLVALDEALTGLAEADETKAELVKLRYFAGLTIEQAAEILSISPATAKRHWTYARAWLYGKMRAEE
jgi:RNA polymerase sigma factor (TIGR02999 family)